MRVCPACGRECGVGRDFCECGEYLEWEAAAHRVVGDDTTATLARPAPGAPRAGRDRDRSAPAGEGLAREPGAVERSAPVGPPPDDDGAATATLGDGASAAPVLLGVRRLQDDGYATPGRVEVGVPAGGRSLIMALIRNQSGIVDNYDLAVEGLPESWWTVTPQTAYLVPFGRGAGYEQEIEIALHPPRTPQAEARPWSFMVVARSHASQLQVASVHATIVIEPYWEIDAVVRPRQAGGRLGARFQATVRNCANAPVDVTLKLADDEQLLRFEPGARVVTLGALRLAFLPGLGRLGRRLRLGQRLHGLQSDAPHLPDLPSPDGAGGGLVEHERREAKSAMRKRQTEAKQRAKGAARSTFSAPEADTELTDTGRVATLGPGESSTIPFVVRSERQVWLGRQVGRRFTVAAQTADERVAATVRQAVLRQRPWLPWWLLLLVPLIIAAIIAYLLLRPTFKTVPTVIGARSAFLAESELQQRGLTLAPSVRTRVDPHAAAGSVIAQTPAAGTRVKSGSAVAILVATATGKVKVPKVVGESLSRAVQTLTNAGLTLGPVSPKPDPKRTIAKQIPGVGVTIPRGTPVDVFLTAPKKKKHKAGKHKAGAAGAAGATPSAAASGAGAGAGAKGGSGNKGGASGGGSSGASNGGGAASAKIAIPAIAGATLNAYDKALSKVGLSADPTLAIDRAKRGTVLTTAPSPGTKVKPRTVVAVTASAGSPKLAYDTGSSLKAADGVTGSMIPGFVPKAGTATQPSWSASGTEIAYVSDGSIIAAPVGGRRSRPITIDAGASPLSYAHPAFAPTTGPGLIASVRTGGASDALCFSRLSASGVVGPHCRDAAGWRLGPLSWASDGKSILAGARSVADPERFGLLRFTTGKPFSPRASQWSSSNRLVTPQSEGRGVLAAALSPDGKYLAVLSNLKSRLFRVLLTKPGDLRLKKARRLPLFGCALAWRSDSEELAVVQSDPLCQASVGPIFGFAPGTPREITMLVLQGENPAWQPVALTIGAPGN